MPSFTAIDFETANSSRSSACAVGVVSVRGGKVTDTFYSLIQPYPDFFDFHPFNVEIHGITEDDVEDAPEFNQVWNTIQPMIQDGILVAHSAPFDCSVIRNTLPLYNISAPECSIACSVAISKSAWPNLMSYSLPFVADHLGITFEHHHALEDAMASAEIVLRACEQFKAPDLEALKTTLGFNLGWFRKGDYLPSGISKTVVMMRQKEIPLPSAEDYAVSVSSEHPLCDKDVAFTGTLRSMPRDLAFELVKRAGGRARTCVSPNTEYLVMGLQDYSRFRDGKRSGKARTAEALKAKGHPIEIISEQDFLRMVEWE